MQLTFNESGDTLYTASVDKTVGMFDSMTGKLRQYYEDRSYDTV